MSDRPDDSASDLGAERTSAEAAGPAAAKSLGALEKLRDRVEVAARELRRLREENEALAQRLAEMEANPAAGAEGAFVPLDEDPELLRRKVSGFIEAIDRYLDRDPAPPPSSS